MSPFGRNPETGVSESDLAGAARRHGLSSKANQKLNFSNWQLLPIRAFPDASLHPCLSPPYMPANDTPTSTFCAYSSPKDFYTCSRLVTTLREHISLAHNLHSSKRLPTPSHHLLPPTYHYSNCYYLYTDIGNGDYGHGGRGQDV